MASQDSELLCCYNKGCGSKFNPRDNKEDSCTFHPGDPVFHDAYKGWSCCNKRSIDFNEFLNIKGCKKSFHSDVKPPEPMKIEKPKSQETYEYKAPQCKVPVIKRPPFNSPLTKMQPVVSVSLKSQIESLTISNTEVFSSGEIKIGASCKNSGCRESYNGPQAPITECSYHKGVPVFHEGMKYWSCCNKKTPDFTVFLEQPGCTVGEHVWLKEENASDQSKVRYDWHQTGSFVFISVYAKMCDPNKSCIEINPIRIKLHLKLLTDDSYFDKDFELYGVVDVEKSGVSMMPTKVEIKLKKAEPGSWSKLHLSNGINVAKENGKHETVSDTGTTKSVEDDLVDLKDIS